MSHGQQRCWARFLLLDHGGLRFFRRHMTGLSRSAVAATAGTVSIGGIGGSGTRLVAAILAQLGYCLDGDNNATLDNLWFTLLFKRRDVLGLAEDEFSRRVDIFLNAMTARVALTDHEKYVVAMLAREPPPDLSVEKLNSVAGSLLAVQPRLLTDGGRWGWKEPNTHIVIDRLAARMPGLKYIHVVRNGLDMAYSSNQTQLRLWGSFFLGEDGLDVTPRNSLKFWCAIHRRILGIEAELGDRVLLMSFDALCLRPDDMLDRLCEFLGCEPTVSQRACVRRLIQRPASIGRFKKRSPRDCDRADVEFVASLGFDTRFGSE
ncbi:MAG: hypothetical protein EA400_15615 [Chromatiaceae bacterium]|nr:MAG: hypothetical protein EA400_15615 [Chromatiaceae bacterium]